MKHTDVLCAKCTDYINWGHWYNMSQEWIFVSDKIKIIFKLSNKIISSLHVSFNMPGSGLQWDDEVSLSEHLQDLESECLLIL